MDTVVHVTQRYNWDCGLACVMMILNNEQRLEFQENFTKICDDEGFGTSVWTIDLCFLLMRFKIRHLFCSVRLGVNPDYSNLTYYGSMIKFNTNRIEKKISMASKVGIKSDERPVFLHDIIAHLDKGKPIIVLVNASYLFCPDCIFDMVRRFFFNFITCGHAPYYGHYIVVISYDLKSKEILYRDPLKNNEICRITFENFDKARTSYGTDEDLIFVL